MSVYKCVHLPNRLMALSAAKQSEEGDMGICTDDGLYVLKPRVFADKNPSNEFVVQVSKIPPITEVNEFDVGVKHDSIQREMYDAGEIRGDFLEVMMNRTLSPQIESLQANRGFILAAWSPCGADSVGRPVIASLSGDHRLDIISLGGRDRGWERVVSISDMYQNLMKDRNFELAEWKCPDDCSDVSESIKKLKERTYLLAGVAAEWSPSFYENSGVGTADSTEPQTKKRKTDSQQISSATTTNRTQYAYLVQAVRSGHLVLWKVKFPVCSKADVSLISVTGTHVKPISVVRWCSTNSDSPGIIAVGYNDSVLRLYPVRWKDGDAEICEPLTLFDEGDYIRINVLTWDESRNILYIGKGPYLFAMMLNHDVSKDTVTIRHETHIAISPRLMINEIHLTSSGISVSACDDVVVLLECNFDKDLSLTKFVDIKTPHTLTGPYKPWRNYGHSWTKNNVFAVILCSPAWNFCHLEHRKPLKVHFVSQKNTEQVVDILMNAKPDALMADYIDCLVFIKQINYTNEGVLPETLMRLMLEEEKWNSLDSFRLKFLRNLLKFQVHLKKKPEEKEEVQKKIQTIEDMISKKWIIIIVQKVLENLNTTTTSPEQLLSLSLMCEWISNKGTEKEKAIAKKIQGKYKEKEWEICVICGEVVKLTSLTKDGCINGHYFGRCSHSLILCQEVPYRVCEECGSLATTKDKKAVPIQDHYLEDYCPICDHRLNLP